MTRCRTDGSPASRQGSTRRGIVFASCYVYSPGGADAASERSRMLRDLLKHRDTYFMQKVADRVRHEVADGPALTGFFSNFSLLVPIPGSAALAAHSHSVAHRLAVALLDGGIGDRLYPLLERKFAVIKSATAARGSRPTVATHYASFSVNPLLAAKALDDTATHGAPRQIILIDDVVTKGRTLLAAAARVQEAVPAAQIRAFALVRTMGLVPAVKTLLDPCVGKITWRGGDARRYP